MAKLRFGGPPDHAAHAISRLRAGDVLEVETLSAIYVHPGQFAELLADLAERGASLQVLEPKLDTSRTDTAGVAALFAAAHEAARQAGLATGKQGGRPRKHDLKSVDKAFTAYGRGGLTIEQAAEKFGIPRSALAYRIQVERKRALAAEAEKSSPARRRKAAS